MHVLASRTELASQFSVLRARVLQMPRQLLILLFEQLSGHIGESGLLGPISEILASDEQLPLQLLVFKQQSLIVALEVLPASERGLLLLASRYSLLQRLDSFTEPLCLLDLGAQTFLHKAYFLIALF